MNQSIMTMIQAIMTMIQAATSALEELKVDI